MASHSSGAKISAVVMSGKTCAVVAFSGSDGMSNFPVSVACMWLELAHCTMRPFDVCVLLRRQQEVVTKFPVAAVSRCPPPFLLLLSATVSLPKVRWSVVGGNLLEGSSSCSQ